MNTWGLAEATSYGLSLQAAFAVQSQSASENVDHQGVQQTLARSFMLLERITNSGANLSKRFSRQACFCIVGGDDPASLSPNSAGQRELRRFYDAMILACIGTAISEDPNRTHHHIGATRAPPNGPPLYPRLSQKSLTG